MRGNYIVQAKNTVLPNQRYLWFALMDFLYHCTNYKQDQKLETAIKFDSLDWPTFEKIIDFSMHNAYWDTLYTHTTKSVSTDLQDKTASYLPNSISLDTKFWISNKYGQEPVSLQQELQSHPSLSYVSKLPIFNDLHV